jgi:hypothetical protein
MLEVRARLITRALKFWVTKLHLLVYPSYIFWIIPLGKGKENECIGTTPRLGLRRP